MIALAARTDRQVLEQLSDHDIVARVLAGDTPLFELLMRRHNRRLYRIARIILGDDAEAEDALQEAYVRAYLKLAQFRGPEGFTGWLCRITTNEALSRRRAHSGITLVNLDALDDPTHQEAAMADIDSPNHNPEVAAQEHEFRRLLEQAIDSLPETYRAVFALREIEQLSVQETAAYLGIEPGAVRTRVHRARRLLQQRLTVEISAALRGVHAFDGDRCDRLVERVFQRLGTLPRA